MFPGTSCAYQLSKEAPELKGIVLEAASLAHKGGSSYGESRMFRQLYSDPYYSKMQASRVEMTAPAQHA